MADTNFLASLTKGFNGVTSFPFWRQVNEGEIEKLRELLSHSSQLFPTYLFLRQNVCVKASLYKRDDILFWFCLSRKMIT